MISAKMETTSEMGPSEEGTVILPLCRVFVTASEINVNM